VRVRYRCLIDPVPLQRNRSDRSSAASSRPTQTTCTRALAAYSLSLRMTPQQPPSHSSLEPTSLLHRKKVHHSQLLITAMGRTSSILCSQEGSEPERWVRARTFAKPTGHPTLLWLHDSGNPARISPLALDLARFPSQTSCTRHPESARPQGVDGYPVKLTLILSS
jgi:hypothetical protein